MLPVIRIMMVALQPQHLFLMKTGCMKGTEYSSFEEYKVAQREWSLLYSYPVYGFWLVRSTQVRHVHLHDWVYLVRQQQWACMVQTCADPDSSTTLHLPLKVAELPLGCCSISLSTAPFQYSLTVYEIILCSYHTKKMGMHIAATDAFCFTFNIVYYLQRLFRCHDIAKVHLYTVCCFFLLTLLICTKKNYLYEYHPLHLSSLTFLMCAHWTAVSVVHWQPLRLAIKAKHPCDCIMFQAT